MAGGEKQEIYDGVLADLVEKARHIANTGKAPIMVFRVIYDDEQGLGVFDDEGIRCRGMGGGEQKERTVHQRKHEVGYL